jgi:hypothetical protein
MLQEPENKKSLVTPPPGNYSFNKLIEAYVQSVPTSPLALVTTQ